MYCFEGKLVHFPGYYQEALVGRGIQFPKNNAWRCAYRIGTWKKLLGIHGECQWNVKNTRKEIDALHDSKELTNSCEHVSKFTAKDKPVNFGGRHYGWLPQTRRYQLCIHPLLFAKENCCNCICLSALIIEVTNKEVRHDITRVSHKHPVSMANNNAHSCCGKYFRKWCSWRLETSSKTAFFFLKF